MCGRWLMIASRERKTAAPTSLAPTIISCAKRRWWHQHQQHQRSSAFSAIAAADRMPEPISDINASIMSTQEFAVLLELLLLVKELQAPLANCGDALVCLQPPPPAVQLFGSRFGSLGDEVQLLAS